MLTEKTKRKLWQCTRSVFGKKKEKKRVKIPNDAHNVNINNNSVISEDIREVIKDADERELWG